MPDVETWIITARAVHEDIERLRRLANDIVREAEADEQKLELLSDRTTHLQLLERESLFSKRLGDALQSINRVNDDINKAEQAARESNVLEALKLLAGMLQKHADRNISIAYLFLSYMGNDRLASCLKRSCNSIARRSVLPTEKFRP